MDLVRDLLDKQVRDMRFRKVGRVDGLVLELRAGEPPKLAALEIGGPTLAKRLHPRVRAWYQTLARWLGAEGESILVDARDIGTIDLNVTLTIDAKDHPRLLAAERRLAARFHKRIPV